MATAQDPRRRRAVEQKALFEYVFGFIVDVAAAADKNKMDRMNLATVLGPTLLRTVLASAGVSCVKKVLELNG